jgi:hypothetical protein
MRLVVATVLMARKFHESCREDLRQIIIRARYSCRLSFRVDRAGICLRCAAEAHRQDAAFLDGAPDLDVLDHHRINHDWLVGEDREVGELAHLDASRILFHPQRVRSIQGHGLEGTELTDPLLRTPGPLRSRPEGLPSQARANSSSHSSP